MKKIIKITGVVAIMTLVGIVAIYYRIPVKITNAQATTAPTVNITVGYNTTSLPGSSFPYGNYATASISSIGPFTEDFQYVLCNTNPATEAVTCVTSPWASAAAEDGGVSNGNDGNYAGNYTDTGLWTPNIQSGSGGYLWPVYIQQINTRPLPVGTELTNVQVGVSNLADDHLVSVGRVAPEIGAYACGPSITPTPTDRGVGVMSGNGGAGYPAYAPFNGNCNNGLAVGNDGQNFDMSIYVSASLMGAQPFSNNIPSTFTVNQTQTTGTDNNPIDIVVKNIGTTAWVSNQSTVITGSQSGTCDGTGGAEPSTSDPQGTSCTVSLNNYSDVFELEHTSGSFSVGTNPVQYSEITKQTCTVGPPACNDSDCTTAQTCRMSIEQDYCAGPGAGPGAPENGCTVNNCGGSDCPDGELSSGCGSQWVPQIQCSTTSGDPNIEPGANATFDLTSLTAPSTAGIYTENWQMNQKGGIGNFGTPISVPITVASTSTPPATPAGTVNVTSENSQISSVGQVLVPAASWDLLGNPTTESLNGITPGIMFDVCTDESNLTSKCSGSSATYANQPTLNSSGAPGLPYTITNPTLSPAYIGLYRFHGVQASPIVQNTNTHPIGITAALLAFSKNFFISTADASTCSNAPDCYSSFYNVGSSVFAGTLSPNQTIGLTILWDPIANIGLNPVMWSPAVQSGSSPVTQQVAVSNSGAPGSTLTWSASATTVKGGSWLSVSPSSDSSGLTNQAPPAQDASDNVTVTADPSGLGVGTYMGTVTFEGTSAPAKGSSAPSASFAVTLTVSNSSGGGAGYDCVNNACSSVPSGAQYGSLSSCTTACGGGGATSTPPGGAGYDCVNNACSSVPSGAQYGSLSSCTTACGGGGATSTPSLVACTPGVNCPVCSPTLNANPTSIVVPESSTLSYSCSNVTECQLTRNDTGQLLQDIGAGASNTIDSTYNATPSITTAYTLTCVNSNYLENANNPVSASATVTVGGSGICEQNPNGVGCPGQ